MVQDNANKPNQVAARIYLPQEDPMLPVKTLWFEADHWVTLYAQLDQELVDRVIDSVRMDIYTRWNDSLHQEKDWTYKHTKTYIHPLKYPEYMFLKTSDAIWRNSFDVADRMCIHIPSGTTFHIFHRNKISFGKSVVEDKHNIFYKFTYTGEDGTVTPMIIHTQTNEVKSEDEINHIKYDILKNGAKWFCEHLTAGNDGNWFGNVFKYNL